MPCNDVTISFLHAMYIIDVTISLLWDMLRRRYCVNARCVRNWRLLAKCPKKTFLSFHLQLWTRAVYNSKHAEWKTYGLLRRAYALICDALTKTGLAKNPCRDWNYCIYYIITGPAVQFADNPCRCFLLRWIDLP